MTTMVATTTIPAIMAPMPLTLAIAEPEAAVASPPASSPYEGADSDLRKNTAVV